MLEAFLLLALIALAAWWYDSRRAQEIAIEACRGACSRQGVQFLDEVAALSRLGFVRDARGVLQWRRTYSFEYSTAEGERRSGMLVMLGRTPSSLSFEGRTTYWS
jgi:hypothetical protein